MQALVPATVPGQNGRDIGDGIYPGMSRPEYERIEAANYSTIKHFRRTCAHAREAMIHPREPSAAMNLGTAEHVAILEPARFEREYIESPDVDRRTKDGKTRWAEFEDEHRGRSFLLKGEMEAVKGMMEQAYAHGIARQLLSSPGANEVAVVWTDRQTGLRCKALIDRIVLHAGHTVVMDLKTTRDASPWGFAKQVANLQYHEQAAFYLEGLAAHGPMPRRWVWLAAETERPYCVATYEPDDQMLRAGKRLFREHLDALALCRKDNFWPGWPASVEQIRLPKWALTGEDDDA